MAEILFLQRGNYRAVDDFERFLDGTLLPFERTFHEYEDGENPITKEKVKVRVDKQVKYGMQIGRREYKIVGLAVPDKYVNPLLNGLNVGDGEVHPIQASIAVKALRKALGAEKIPTQKERGNEIVTIPRPGVAIYPIGVKKDEVSTWADVETGKQFTQENL